MEGLYEDAASIDFSLTQKYPFYTFFDGSEYQGFPWCAHWHYYIELLYCTKGVGRVIINGYTYEFKQGDTLFIFPRDVHTFCQYNHQLFEYLVIKLDPDILFDTKSQAFAFKHFGQLLDPIPPEMKLIAPRQLANFDPLDFLTIHDLFYHKPYQFDWKVKSMLLHFFYNYATWLASADILLIAKGTPNDELTNIMPAFEYINKHYNDSINAKEVAQYCHLSYSYFSRQFKKITGIAFTQYLNILRITEAEKLLLDQGTSVTDIGFKVGFTDTSYFIKQFKKYKKVTPKKFLQLIRNDF